MTDAEITRLCAEAMPEWQLKARRYGMKIDPLHNDAQALWLVKRFRLDLLHDYDNNWVVAKARTGLVATWSKDLNQAICEYIATMQKESS